MGMKFELTHANIVRVVIGILGVSMALYHMWLIWVGAPEAIMFRGTHLLFALALTFLVYRRTTAQSGQPPTLLDYGCLILATAPVIYLFVNYDYVVNRIYYVDDLTTADMVLGTILVVMILEATRRVIGPALPLTALVFWLTASSLPASSRCVCSTSCI
jgi:TRAP-type uncharacterized transport system, fused permease components